MQHPLHHGTKNQTEVLAYKKRVDDAPLPEKTVKDPVNLENTDESTVDEKDVDNKLEIRKKSTKFKIWDFIREHIVGEVIVGVILFLLATFFAFTNTQSIQGEKISNIESTINEIKQNNSSANGSNDETTKGIQSILNQLKEDFISFKTGVDKDIEYLKEKVNSK